MTKNSNRFRDEWDDELDQRSYREERAQHRKMKRMKNALRSRHYEDLYDEDDY